MVKKETTSTVNKAVQILKCFSTHENELSLTNISQKLNISLSSTQRILNTLTNEGLLEKDNRRKTYKLGLELYFLGNLVEANSQLLTITKRYMQDLNDQTGETITLNVIHKNKRKCIGYVIAKHELTTISYISKQSPLYAGASAKTLLAYSSKAMINQLINSFNIEPITENTTLDKDKLLKQLDDIRKKGYAVSNGERVLGVHAISAPIKNRFNEVIASLTITIPSIRGDESKSNLYTKWLLECTNNISSDLGFNSNKI